MSCSLRPPMAAGRTLDRRGPTWPTSMAACCASVCSPCWPRPEPARPDQVRTRSHPTPCLACVAPLHHSAHIASVQSTLPICRFLNADHAPLLRAKQDGKGRNVAAASSEVVPHRFVGLALAVCAALERFSVDHERTPPAGMTSNVAFHLMRGAAKAGARARRSGSGSRRTRRAAPLPRQLEHDVAAVAHDPGTDLDQLLAQRRQRPLGDHVRQRQRPEEVPRL